MMKIRMLFVFKEQMPLTCYIWQACRPQTPREHLLALCMWTFKSIGGKLSPQFIHVFSRILSSLPPIVVNLKSKAKPIKGQSKKVETKLCDLNGNMNFIVVNIDGFHFVLGLIVWTLFRKHHSTKFEMERSTINTTRYEDSGR